MDTHRFDALARSLAAPKTRRGFLGSLAALGVGLLGARSADAQVTQAQCGNRTCANNPGRCAGGCVCCVYGNGNSRCRPPGTCLPGTTVCPPGQAPTPAGGCAAPTTTTSTTTTAAPTTTTTAAPTTTTTTTAGCLPGETHCGGVCTDTMFDSDNCGTCGTVCEYSEGRICLGGECQCQPGLVDCPGVGFCVLPDDAVELGCRCTGTCP